MILLPEDEIQDNLVSFIIRVNSDTLDTHVGTKGLATCGRQREVVKAACCFMLAAAVSSFGQEFIAEILQPTTEEKKEEKTDASS